MGRRAQQVVVLALTSVPWAERSATDIVRAVNDDDYEDYNVSNELQIEYYD